MCTIQVYFVVWEDFLLAIRSNRERLVYALRQTGKRI